MDTDPMIRFLLVHHDDSKRRQETEPGDRPGISGRRRLEAVLFDWDGTLVDSAEVSYRAYVASLGSFGISFDRDTYRRTYAPDWTHTYEAVGLRPADWSQADRLWLEAYARERPQLVPGARDLLDALGRRGLRLGIVSSGDGQRVRAELRDLGVTEAFSVVVCGGDTERRKPDPQPLLRAVEQLGVAPLASAYVGDSPEDVQMARAVGALTVGIPGGFPNRESLAASRPDLLLDSIESLESALTRDADLECARGES